MIEAVAGMIFFAGIAACGIFVFGRILSIFQHRNDPPNVTIRQGIMHVETYDEDHNIVSVPICTASRRQMITSLYAGEERERAIGFESPRPREIEEDWYHARPIEPGRRAPMVTPQHGEEWDYPVEIPQPQKPEGIPAPNWPVRVRK